MVYTDDPSDVFCFWTNKGGVGKTTLAFTVSTNYAFLHPETNVIMIDCDPQCNLSQVLLTRCSDRNAPAESKERVNGEDVVFERANEVFPNTHLPKTIVGWFSAQTQNMANPPRARDYLMNISDHNPNVPPNMVRTPLPIASHQAPRCASHFPSSPFDVICSLCFGPVLSVLSHVCVF